jgi:hypothetical protein
MRQAVSIDEPVLHEAPFASTRRQYRPGAPARTRSWMPASRHREVTPDRRTEFGYVLAWLLPSTGPASPRGSSPGNPATIKRGQMEITVTVDGRAHKRFMRTQGVLIT